MQITVGIITISDRATTGEYEDLGGPALKDVAEKAGWGKAPKARAHAEQHCKSNDERGHARLRATRFGAA